LQKQKTKQLQNNQIKTTSDRGPDSQVLAADDRRILTRNCDQSNYFSRIGFSYIPIEFGQKRISAIRSADPKTLP